MEKTSENKATRPSKHICIGMLAHVDAGKTTLSEAILYTSGSIRTLGRVDKGNAFLDTEQLEKQRGITIFSKQAELTLKDKQVTLLDTPGHVDFSAEMERTLQVLDYAVLVISGAEGVQSHTQTLWKLLRKHRIPTFLFINKMDRQETDADLLLLQLQKRLDGGCIRFGKGIEGTEEFYDSAAMCSEALMEAFLENEKLTDRQIAQAIGSREIFPCYFGSALKLQGVDDFLRGLETYIQCPSYGDVFGARVFKISRDAQGNRLTHMKMTGGRLKVRDTVSGMYQRRMQEEEEEQDGTPPINDTAGRETKASSAAAKAGRNAKVSEARDTLQTNASKEQQEAASDAGENLTAQEYDWQEKVTQLRIYSGGKYTTIEEACAGMVCTAVGLRYTESGMGLGFEQEQASPLLIPVLTYRVLLPQDIDPAAFLPKLKLLEEEEPLLQVVWNQHSREISVQVMGEVQIEILKHLVLERFGVEAAFGEGTILYKETIADTVVGVGHFEPLRHYAEVHLRLEPLADGSGLAFASECSEEVLAKNWQRLVLTHLAERVHKGVLTGSPITDMKMTLIAGRAHLKHTEGGDFRQATYRAVRQGLMEAASVLLEPYYSFLLEVPERNIGRAMTDLERMCAQFTLQQTGTGDEAVSGAGEGLVVLEGTVPVSTIANYQKEVSAYTGGRGRLSCGYYGYRPCHNAEEVCAAAAYDPELDACNPSGSVFCVHGAGYYVPWDEVKAHRHVISEEEKHAQRQRLLRDEQQSGDDNRGGIWLSPDEVDKIVAQAGSANKKAHIDPSKRWGQRYTNAERTAASSGGAVKAKPAAPKEKYLLVDGYNIIFAWDELHALAEDNIDGARGRLMDILSNYQSFSGMNLMLVFDAYRVKGHPTEVFSYYNIQVVYTKEAETADQYIERFAHKNSKQYDITVATSDGLEQIIIRSQGCRLLSAKDFYQEVAQVDEHIREAYENYVRNRSLS